MARRMVRSKTNNMDMRQISRKIKYGGETFILYQLSNSRVCFISENYNFTYRDIEQFKRTWYDIQKEIEKSLIKVIWI